MHWVDTYPHTVYASVLLLDNKIENYKIGERHWKHPFDIKNYWKLDRMDDYKVKYIGFEVNNDFEHQQAFEFHARQWFKQWEIADDYKGGRPY